MGREVDAKGNKGGNKGGNSVGDRGGNKGGNSVGDRGGNTGGSGVAGLEGSQSSEKPVDDTWEHCSQKTRILRKVHYEDDQLCELHPTENNFNGSRNKHPDYPWGRGWEGMGTMSETREVDP